MWIAHTWSLSFRPLFATVSKKAVPRATSTCRVHWIKTTHFQSSSVHCMWNQFQVQLIRNKKTFFFFFSAPTFLKILEPVRGATQWPTLSFFCNSWSGPAFSADGGHSEQMKALSVKVIPPTPSDGIGPAERVTAQVCTGNTATVSFKYLQPGLDHSVQTSESVTQNCFYFVSNATRCYFVRSDFSNGARSSITSPITIFSDFTDQ